MRRSTAISQVLLLLALYAAPLVAGSSSALPACCRRDGAHHCAMQQQVAGNQAADNQTSFSSPVHCPYRFPAIVLTHASKLFLKQASTTTFLSASREISCHGIAGHTQAVFASALDNRGPPSLAL
jgi:hypothetical protein